MKKKVVKCIQSGCVQETMAFSIQERANIRNAKEPSPRHMSDTEREAHKLGISRRNHSRLANANWTPEYIHSILTFSEEPADYAEARRQRDNFVRRVKRKYPDAIIFIYLGRGRHTKRIHAHLVSFGIPQEVIEELWGYGIVAGSEYLWEHNYYNGVDHGQDYTELADYLFSHWTPEQGGRRWKNTRNIKRPVVEIEEVNQDDLIEKLQDVPKGYLLVEDKFYDYGLKYHKYVRNPADYLPPPNGQNFN